ncbi:ATP-binding protein [Cereibacter changlensis JA139]|uniref:ATP-binding protein n=2 Tax=Cereibacter changlensis TaxID=402884 RepID=A0A2T4K048_9RHOB|nr:ATP-binding protein [Cereibacter changlensis]PTE23528.1 ATP-binding protein [Cereibacter changlensis JA139]PZX58557.1 serine/threonine-protein kinase RsbW [Cereibacter changlensis]
MRRDGGETGLVLDSHPLAVRAALRRLLDAPPLDGLDEEARWRAELVLAEVLNNVVVHGQPRGRIVVRLRLEGEALAFRISDQGLPLPGGRLPKGVLQAPDTLSEGGFGWPLIRALASDLEYRRAEGVNHLSFRIGPACPGPEPPRRDGLRQAAAGKAGVVAAALGNPFQAP